MNIIRNLWREDRLAVVFAAAFVALFVAVSIAAAINLITAA